MLHVAGLDRDMPSRYAAHVPLTFEQRQEKSPVLFLSLSSLVLNEESGIDIIYTQSCCPFLVAVMAEGAL